MIVFSFCEIQANGEANGIYGNATVADSALATEVRLFPFRIDTFLLLWDFHTLE